MRTLIFLSLFPLLAAAASPAPVSSTGVDTSAMDKQADPCADFYQYACGSWMASHPIPADRARWGRFEELAERNESVLLDLLQTAAKKRDGRTPAEQKLGDAYAACMDEAAIEKRGLAPIKEELERIRSLDRYEDLMDEIARLHSIGVDAVFKFRSTPDYKDSNRTIASIDQGGLSLPDRDYYLKTDAKSVELRQKFEAHMVKMFQLLGDSAATAASKARQAMALETTMATVSMDRVSMRDPQKRYNPVTKAKLMEMSPDVPWVSYFQGIGAPDFDSLNLSSPQYLMAMSQQAQQHPIEAWRAYFTYRLLAARAEQLPAAFEKEAFDFHQRILGGFQEPRPRAKRCVAAVDRSLGDLLGKQYVERTFGGTSKEQITEMVDALERALAKDIGGLPWMSEETKQAALVKLRLITNNVGVPKTWRDYSGVSIAADDFLGNTVRAQQAQIRRNLAKIGKPTDKSEWMMTAPTVNAFYSSQYNSINFPAGILQPPFFDAQRDAALNFGGIGAVIGHELTHGFDDSGRKFDGDGNLRDWWTANDGTEFEKRVACIADQYSSYTAVGDVKLNGRLTLGENTADGGGVRVALMAMIETMKSSAKVDGYTPEQRLFLGFAQVWCQNVRPEQSRARAMTDPHSPGRYRVNGTFSNMPEFQKAFACKAGQPMVSSNACRVW